MTQRSVGFLCDETSLTVNVFDMADTVRERPEKMDIQEGKRREGAQERGELEKKDSCAGLTL